MPLHVWGLIHDCLHFATTTQVHNKQTIIGPIVTAIQCQAEIEPDAVLGGVVCFL